ncbi:MAG: toll/interleukin-1 receptor domain-containing protein [Betaproteobacteria bacterium]|nr:toll/interleukin-1 receptor domain-containing protein [Betaproteobacteria bacterium]
MPMTSLLNISTPFSSSHVVFIAHKSDALDTQVADLLAEELRWRKISYFLDKDTLILGDDFENRILSAVGSATLVVVLFQKESSHWVYFEAACATCVTGWIKNTSSIQPHSNSHSTHR